MNWQGWLLITILLSSFVPGIIFFGLREESSRLRTSLNLSGATLKLVLILIMDIGIYFGHTYEIRIPLLGGLELPAHGPFHL